jgi:hypothetical protein
MFNRQLSKPDMDEQQQEKIIPGPYSFEGVQTNGSILSI